MAWSRGLLRSTALMILSCLHCIEVTALVSANEISGFSLSPPYFNLAEGSAISASATCGEDQNGRPRSDLFCKLVGGPTVGLPSQTIQGQFCDVCDGSDPRRAHPASQAIDGTERWWQSPPLSRGLAYNQVNVTLDLGQLFHVAYIIIKFANAPRPDLWVLERSVDHGRSFTPWQYFAHSDRDCIERFGRQANGRVLRDDDQICTTEYSRIVPLENGEVVVSLINGRPGSKNFTHSPTLQEFTKATNIRLHFLQTSTLLGHLISKAQRDPTVTRRYYYSIKDISVGGRCVCHGHAQVCGTRVPGQPVQLLCECQHNTCGESCDQCCPGYHQKPWRPATADSPNECEPCQCHSHATDCYYDDEVARRRTSLNVDGRYDGGGVCLNCQHHTAGVNCEVCAPGFYRPHGVPPESPTGCRPCRCDSRTTIGCEMGSGRCVCKPQYSGENCDHCAHGYDHYPQCISYPVGQTTTEASAGNIFVPQCPVGFFGAPHCQPCVCEHAGTTPQVCDASGRCICRPEVTSERCDHCRQGHHSFPYCWACRCDGPGVVERWCGPDGRCRCRSTHAGPRCERCAVGHYAYPTCTPCGCSREGSRETACDPEVGQCVCRPGVTGLRCDRCMAAHLSFPHCSEHTSLCNPAGSEVSFADTDACVCLPYVEGAHCELCKPLYWNLSPENPRGCVDCTCDVKGTRSGVGECQQESGECFCKPNICSQACDTCQDGYFLLQKKNYFGCQGCQCDVGGAVGRSCEETTGQCQCRKHMRGRTCSEPELNFYLPNLHHMKVEAENGITPNARPVRFGYDQREFPQFSWRGYAVLTPAQSEACVNVHVSETQPSLFLVLLRYVNRVGGSVTGRVTMSRTRGGQGRRESKEVMFPPSASPSFLTVPGDGFAQPFTLTPGKWTACLQGEGVLLDYMVLLPSAYYEAGLLRQEVTEPCSYLTSSGRGNCLLYKHMVMDRFPFALASQGVLSVRRRRHRQAHIRRPTVDHPELAFISGRQSQLRLTLHIPESGSHVLVLEYASEMDIIQNVNVMISGWPWEQTPTRANIYSCAYSFLCRSVVVDARDRIAHFLLPPKTEILVQSTASSLLLYRVFAVPSAAFTMELVDPKVLCVSVHGRFTEGSEHCLQSQFPSPSTALVMEANPVARPGSQSSGRCDGLLLKSPQTEVELSAQVPLVGRYVFIVHYCQPEHPSFLVDVRVDTGKTWSGLMNASFCPAVSGCRTVVVAEQRIALDVTQHTLTITLKIPAGKTLVLDSVLVVPEDDYSPELLRPEARDKSSDFTSQCGAQSFAIDPHSSELCKTSARSLVAHYHHGALPCFCDKAGSTSPTCEPIGGQCSCRPHVIGRQCIRCATGFYGFPYCRPCECGRRLCDEVTGECICPPQTVRPACDVCERQTFSYHPLLGCEDCDCSLSGIPSGDSGQCNVTTGQCTCKPRVGGRQCSRCLHGYYGFPDCTACSCDSGGVTLQICDPSNGSCLCKSNVAGPRCNMCQRGSFHFDPDNPKGCTNCFCFGVTDQCRSSEKRRAKFVDMRSWRLVTSDLDEVPSVLNPLSNTVVSDVQEVPPSVGQLYWVLPQSYLGDRVSSYGGFLTYQSKSFGLPREGMRLLEKQPDVLLKSQKMTLVYQDPQSPSPDRLYQGRVHLVEANFRHSGTNRPVSREEFVRVLARLQGVWLRALYFTNSQRLSVGEVGLEEASQSGSGGHAHTVEVCACPPQYAGDSCQRCAPGFYRDRNDRCVPCACNGLSDDCEESTGRCLNCQANTAGYRCERCKDGYYGNAALRTCQLCPCPHGHQGNNFAVGCRVVNGRLQCICKVGYDGQRCERCSPGYYGDPSLSGGSCQPCNCNGNSCSPKTGVCSNSQEPKDTDTHEECPVCDSCAQTLLMDLEQLDDKLAEIKAQLDMVDSSSSAHDRLKKLEEAIAATKNLVTDYMTAVDRLSPKVEELERDSYSLTEDINLLKQQAEKRSKDAEKAIEKIEHTHQKAKDLNTETLNLLRRIQDLLKQQPDFESGGGSHSGQLLEEAERMVREMEIRNFVPQRTAAEKELDEAQKLLEYIKNNCTKQYEQNQETANRIKGLLKDFEAKLKELERALRDAKDMVQKANSQNTLNSQALNDLLKRIANLEKERDSVAKDITIAKGQLKDTDDLLKKLSGSKKEYEQLAAQLDGAKTDLAERVSNISRAASKESLVKRAEDHAALLNRLANQLEEAVRNSSGRADVKDALAAIDVYKNITEAVNAAEEAAKKAKEAADKAHNDVSQGDIPNRAKNLKDQSNKLLKDAKNSAKDLKQITEDLTNQQERLEAAGKKKSTLEKELLAITDALKGVQRDDIGATIDAAKRTAAAANASTTDTLEKLRNISEEVARISLTPGGSNIDRVLDDVDMTVKNLTSSIPSLLDKITQVESLSSQIDPNNNISNNINRIKELIEQARDAANRIAIPMKFTGSEYVELWPPKNLADLRAYTALNLLLQRPKKEARGDGSQDPGNLFVLYLGNRDTSKDYLGMALRNNILYFIYKLNGNVYEIESGDITDSEPEPAFFDKVDVYRIYQDAEVNLTKLFTSNEPDDPLSKSIQGEPSYNLLDLDPSEAVFYVGGYPDDFTPPDPLKYPKYRGCVEFLTFNERFISLYNFKSLKPDNVTLETPCKRYMQPTVFEYFEGSGYANVQLDRMPKVLILGQTMESHAENAVLLYITDENSFYSLTLERGYVVLRGRDGSRILEPKSTDKKYIMSGELKVIFDGPNQIIRVRMKGVEILTGSYSQGNFKNYFIGGVPSDLRQRDNITTVPLKGCVVGVNAAGKTPAITEKVGVSRGCPEEMLTSRKAEFCTGGSLESTPFDLAGDVTVSLGFRSTEKDGLLLQNKQAEQDLVIRMLNGFVVVEHQNKLWRSKKEYQDGEWHYLTVVKRGPSVELRVDEDDLGEKISDSAGQSSGSDNIVLGKGSLTGCLANVYLRRPGVQWRAEDLSMFTSTGNVLLDVCHATPPPQSMLASHGQSRPQKR